MFIIFLIDSVKLFSLCGIIAVLLMQSVEELRASFTVLMMLFVLSDILDGEAWEKIMGHKGARARRLIDNVSDMLASHSVCIILLHKLHWSMLWYAPLFIRDALLVWMAVVSLFKGRVVVFHGHAHKAAKGGLAVAAVAMVWGWHGEVMLTLAYVFFFISFLDYLGAFRVFLANRNRVRDGIGEIHMHNRFALTGYAFASHRKLREATHIVRLLEAGMQPKLITGAVRMSKNNEAIRRYYRHSILDYWLWWSSWKNIGAMHLGFYDNPSVDHDHATLRLVEKVGELIGVNSNDNILEAGCGYGCSLIHLYKTYGCSGIGINIVPWQLWIARLLAKWHGASSAVQFKKADYAHTPFPEGSLSVAWFMESFCHAPDKLSVLREMMRVLQNGGRIIISDGVFRNDPQLSDDELEYLQPWLGGMVINLNTAFEYEEMLRQAGFSRIEMHDFTDYVRPSLQRLGDLRQTGLLRKRRVPSLRMYEAFEQGLWRYMLITARKP